MGGKNWPRRKNYLSGKVRSAKIICMFIQILCGEGSLIYIVEVGGCKIGKSTDGLPDVASQKDRQLELREDPRSSDECRR